MKEEENFLIAVKWISHFNLLELDKLMSLYADNARHFSPKLKINKPETEGLIIGKEAIGEWFRETFNRIPDLSYELVTTTTHKSRVIIEYIRKVNGEPDMPVAEVFDIVDSKIVYSRVYHG
jgi:predicted SnoaL-like aldol condensation-catalyzing enzyme